MMLKRNLIFILLSFSIFACDSDDGGGTNEPADTFNRGAMLSNWVNDLIIPGYTKMATDAETLKNTVQTFTNEPTLVHLTSARNAWVIAYRQFQQVSLFDIGKADELRLRDNLNLYPTDVESIQENILNPAISLELSSENSSQGFPALEYMLYGVGATDAEVIAFYSSNDNAAENKTYLNRLATRLDELVDQVNEDWQGTYASTFISNDGSSANSSVNLLVNDFLYYYEKSLRAGKVGIPAGVFSTTPLPHNVECLYESNSSKLMLKEALQSSITFFNSGLDEYLDHLDVRRNNQLLSEIINNQFTATIVEINNLEDDFESQVLNNNAQMLAVYDELQKNVIYLKTDMLSALNISVDYVDADGD